MSDCRCGCFSGSNLRLCKPDPWPRREKTYLCHYWDLVRELAHKAKANIFSEVTLSEGGRGWGREEGFILVGKEQSVTVLTSARINYSEIALATCNYFLNNVFVDTVIVWE